MKLLLASGNAGKLRELRAMAAGLPVEVVGPEDVGLSGLEVEEDGTTFEENAAKKARAYRDASGLATIADDSGLCVDALGGAPGVTSARWSGGPSDGRDARNNEKLLNELVQVPAGARGAAFVCCLCIALPSGVERTWTREWRGQIAFWPRGAGGFGYDPLFLLPQLGRTSAELSPEEKNARSHRGQAMRELPAVLRDLAFEEPAR